MGIFSTARTRSDQHTRCTAFFATTTFKLLVLGIAATVLGLSLELAIVACANSMSLSTQFNVYHCVFFIACLFVIGLFILFRNCLRDAPENLFLGIVLVFSCFSVWGYQVNEVSYDVGYHYDFVLEYSEPSRIHQLSQADAEMVFLMENRIETSIPELDSWERSLDEKDAFNAEAISYGRISNLYKRVASLPSSIVLFLTSLLPLSFSVRYIFGHLINAFIYSFVLYFGMKKLKSGKMLYATVALLPTMVFLACNYSYDFWVNALSMYGTACLIGELQEPEKPLRFKSAALMLGSFILAFGPKAIYFPLILVCLLIPKTKFENKNLSKWYRLAVIGASLLVAASFLIPMLIGGAGDGDSRGGSEVNPSNQIVFILTHPLDYAAILFNFLVSYLSPLSTRHYFVNYAYLGVSSVLFWFLSAGVLLITAITDKSPADSHVNTWKSRLLVVCVCAACLVLVPTSMYISFTGVGNVAIAGCQPRYLLPLVFPFLALIGTHKAAWPREKYQGLYNGCILGVMAFVLFGGMWEVYIGLLGYY